MDLPELPEKTLIHLESIRKASWRVSMLLGVSLVSSLLMLLGSLDFINYVTIYLCFSTASFASFVMYRVFLVNLVVEPFAAQSSTLMDIARAEAKGEVTPDSELAFGLLVCLVIGPLIWVAAVNNEDVTALFGGIGREQ